MRAKSVNETQNFERGKDPKKTLGIGGINLFDRYEEDLNDLKMSLSMTKLTTNEEWEDFLVKTLVGKTITANMNKLATVSKEGTTASKAEKGEFTITIKDVNPSEDFSDALDRNFSVLPIIILADEQNNMYTLVLREGEKIHFE